MAKGAPGEVPITEKPGASAVTRSPWLIQTSSRPVAKRPVKSGSCGRGGGDEGAAELGVVAGFDLAAELGHHRLLAVADAEDRDAEGEDLRARRAGCRRR